MSVNSLTNDEVNRIKKICKKIRKNIIEEVYAAKSGHPGGSLSATDILTVLFEKIFYGCMDKKNPEYSQSDRFILSKGHASPLLYAVLANYGYIAEEELKTFRKFGSKLQGHPCSKLLDCVEISTGSLGQGLSMACGEALGFKLDKKNSKIYALLGDGELQEGSVWEAVMCAAHYKLNNIIAVVDRNRLQIDGCTEDVMSLGDVTEKFKSFGWRTFEINGHEINKIYEAFENAKTPCDKPSVIIADTIKGKGVSFMENNAGWHGKVPGEELYLKAIQELSEEG